MAESPVAAEPLEGAPVRAGAPSRRFAGTLRSVEGDLLTVIDEENRKIYNVRFGDIRVARLDFLWPVRAK